MVGEPLTMILTSHWMSLFLDPRGRIGRVGLFASASLMLGIEAFLLVATPEQADGLPVYLLPMKALALWVGTIGLIKRLHDVGRSAWWVLAGMAGLCIWCAVVALVVSLLFGAAALVPGSTGYVILLGLVMLPAIGVTFWLHLEPGDPFPNRFGQPPLRAPDSKPESAAA
jgi:uncharacterized membrane protein YhaH (DUF805 family)